MESEKPMKITKLKVYLMLKNITQRDLANKTSLSTNTINKLVNKGTATPSVLKLISYELGLSLEELKNLLEWKEI